MDNRDTTFYCPTKVYFRKNGLSTIGDIIAQDYHFKKVYLIYARHMILTNEKQVIVDSLKRNGIEFIESTDISANPDVSCVIELIENARKFNPELILACGGGSVMDVGKSLANAYFYDGNPIDFNKKTVKPLHALPVATIPTLSSSGSQMSDSCVISDIKTHFKGGFNSETNRPLFTLLDPTLCYSAPKHEIAIGLVDMFSHTLERYLSPSPYNEPCDGVALQVLREIMDNSKRVLDDPCDYDGQRSLMILSTYAHNGFTSFGKQFMFRIHLAEHIISGRYPNIPHGQGIALLIPVFLSVNSKVLEEKIRRMGQDMFGFSHQSPDCCEKTMKALNEWLDNLPIIHTFKHYTGTDELPCKKEVMKVIVLR